MTQPHCCKYFGNKICLNCKLIKYTLPDPRWVDVGEGTRLNGAVKIISVACGFRSIKIDFSDYPKSLIIRLNEVYVFSIKYRYSYSDILLKHINFI